MKVYLIVLNGAEDIEIHFLSEELWKKIDATDDWNDTLMNLPTGDREEVPGYAESYSSVWEAMKAIDETGDEIVEEHMGYLY